MRKLSTEEFVLRCRDVHGEKYDYSNVQYMGSHVKVILTCPVHGQFSILPYNHLNNRRGCKKCGLDKTHSMKRMSTEEFLKRCEKIHEYQFNREEINFNCLSQLITLVCREHGPFQIQPRNLLRGCGCKLCKRNKRRHSQDDFLAKALDAHGERYDYSKSAYVKSHQEIEIVCVKHGSFFTKPYIHVSGHGGCPRCGDFVSKQENEVCDFVRGLGFDVIPTYRKIPGVREVDIFCPQKMIAIEYNGLYWHSDAFKEDAYHLQKTEAASRQNINLVHVFDDEWQNKKDICKSRLKSVFGIYDRKIYARNTTVEEIDAATSKQFFERNHLQGSVTPRVSVGLYHNGEIVSAMSFGCFRRSLGRKAQKDCYEMLRFCNIINTTVIGGASKLLSFFIKSYSPQQIISYADRRWSNGDLYEKLGFEFVKNTEPNYFYTDGSLKRMNRFRFRKDALVALGHDIRKSERDITREMGLFRVYDCGSKLYSYKRADG